VLVQIGMKMLYGVPPSSTLMLVFGRSRWCEPRLPPAPVAFQADNVNLSSTFECSRNDVIANTA
jgi:hypothetical protein